MTFKPALFTHVSTQLKVTRLLGMYFNRINYINFNPLTPLSYKPLLRFIWQSKSLKPKLTTRPRLLEVKIATSTLSYKTLTRTLVRQDVTVSLRVSMNTTLLNLYHYKNPRLLTYSRFYAIYTTHALQLIYFYNYNFQRLFRYLNLNNSSLTLNDVSVNRTKPLLTYITAHI